MSKYNFQITITLIIIIVLISLGLLFYYEDKLYSYGYINEYKKTYIFDKKSLLSSVILSNKTDEKHIIFSNIELEKNEDNIRPPDIKIKISSLSDFIVIYVSSKYGELFLDNSFISKIIDGTEEKPYIFKINIKKNSDSTIVFKNYKDSSLIVIFSKNGWVTENDETKENE